MKIIQTQKGTNIFKNIQAEDIYVVLRTSRDASKKEVSPRVQELEFKEISSPESLNLKVMDLTLPQFDNNQENIADCEIDKGKRTLKDLIQKFITEAHKNLQMWLKSDIGTSDIFCIFTKSDKNAKFNFCSNLLLIPIPQNIAIDNINMQPDSDRSVNKPSNVDIDTILDLMTEIAQTLSKSAFSHLVGIKQ